MIAMHDAARESAPEIQYCGPVLTGPAAWPPSKNMSRPVLIGSHIFKNAGNSVDRIVSQSFSDRWRTSEGRTATGIQTSDQTRRFLEANPHLTAASSYLARPLLPWAKAKPTVFRRHPVERTRSVHEFVNKNPTQPHRAPARAHRFPGYVRWSLDSSDGGIVQQFEIYDELGPYPQL
jgi:hypothetical protein